MLHSRAVEAFRYCQVSSPDSGVAGISQRLDAYSCPCDGSGLRGVPDVYDLPLAVSSSIHACGQLPRAGLLVFEVTSLQKPKRVSLGRQSHPARRDDGCQNAEMKSCDSRTEPERNAQVAERV